MARSTKHHRSVPTLVLAALAALAMATLNAPGTAGAASRLSIAGMSRHAGPSAGGYGVVIRGHGLRSVRSVYFGQTRAPAMIDVSPTKVIARAPRIGRSLTVHVQVRTADGATPLTHATLFSFVDPPRVTGLSSHGSLPTGGPITVYGHDLRNIRSVTMGGAPIRVTTNPSTTRLSLVAPAHDVGVVSVIVSTAFGTSANTSYDNFRYAPRPTVTSLLWEVRAESQDAVEIEGANLIGATSVSFGNTPARYIQQADDNMIIATPAPHAPGTVHVTVTTASGTSETSADNVLLFTGRNPERWSARDQYDVFRGQMRDVTCPTATDCVAIDDVTATSLSDGHWGQPVMIDPSNVLEAVSCASVDLCAAVDNHGDVVTRVAGVWSAPLPIADTALTDVSCSSDDFCLAIDDGNGYRFGRGGWSGPVPVPTGDEGASLSAVSCASTTYCVATTNYLGDAYVWNGEDFDAAEHIDDHGDMADVSCPTSNYCVAVDQEGYAVTWNGTTWSDPVTVFTGDDAESVSCDASKKCAAISYGSVGATFDGHSWTATQGPINPPTNPVGAEYQIVIAVSCPSGGDCIAVDRAGDTIAFDGSSWQPGVPTFVTQGYASGISCPDTGFCAAVDSDGNAYTEVNGVWSDPIGVLPGLDMRAGVSCVGRSYCVMVTSDGDAATYDGAAWSRAESPPHAVSSVSCVSTTFCLAVGERFDGTHWQTVITPSFYPDAHISCASTTFCAAVDVIGRSIWNGARWSAYVTTGGASSVSCPVPDFCVSVGGDRAQVYRNGAWSGPVTFGTGLATAVSCTSTTYCAVVGDGGQGRVFDGTTWSAPVQMSNAPQPFVWDVSCPATHRCTAMGRGTVYTSAPK